MAGGTRTDKEEVVYFLSEKMPPKLLQALIGSGAAHLNEVSRQFNYLPFCRDKGNIAVKKRLLNLEEARNPGLSERVQAVFAYLEAKVRDRLSIGQPDVEAAFAYADEKCGEPRKVQEMIPLTSKRLTSAHIDNIAGPNDMFLRHIGSLFKNLPLLVENGRIVADDEQLDVLSDKDRGVRIRLQAVMSQLEEIVLSGGVVTAEAIDQAVNRAGGAQNDNLEGVGKLTREGKPIERKDVVLDELKDHVLLEERVTFMTSPDDPSFVPTEILYFKKEGRKALSLMGQQNRVYMERIQDKVGGDLTMIVDKEKLFLRGNPEAAKQARDIVFQLAGLLYERNYSRKEEIAHAVSVVLGEADADSLPQPEEKKKKSRQKNSDREEEFASFGKLIVNAFAPRTKNQERYLKVLADDSYAAVMAQGPAGTGKTRLFLQVAMRKICDHYAGVPGANYRKLILSIPLETVGGRNMGALPGGADSKTAPWFETYYSHLARVLAPMGKNGLPDVEAGDADLKRLLEKGIIEIAPLEFLRGKSFANALISLDEAQNASAEQVKTFLTRAEDSSRLFLFGDLEQTDRGASGYKNAEAYIVPSNVCIDGDGRVLVTKNGYAMNLGFHRDLGRFEMASTGDKLDRVYPRNGFAHAFLLYSESPRIACTCLDFSDIQRSGVGRDILLLDRALRIPGDRGTSQGPVGAGTENLKAMLAAADRPKEGGSFGNVIQLKPGQGGGAA